MLETKFEIDGECVDTCDIANDLERSIVESIAAELRTALANVQDPTTGELPTVIIRGRSLEDITIAIEGSDSLIALASARLEANFDAIVR